MDWQWSPTLVKFKEQQGSSGERVHATVQDKFSSPPHPPWESYIFQTHTYVLASMRCMFQPLHFSLLFHWFILITESHYCQFSTSVFYVLVLFSFGNGKVKIKIPFSTNSLRLTLCIASSLYCQCLFCFTFDLQETFLGFFLLSPAQHYSKSVIIPSSLLNSLGFEDMHCILT